MPRFFSLTLLLCVTLGAGFLPHPASANELQAQIDDKSARIEALQAEITQLQGELDQVGAEKETLENALESLDLSRRRMTTQISLTQTQISRADLQIERLSGSIATTSGHIEVGNASVAGSLRNLNQLDRVPPALVLLSDGTFSSFFTEMTAVEALRDELGLHVEELSTLKEELEDTKAATQKKRAELASLRTRLAGERQALDAAIASQNELLSQTKNKESSYQALIAQKKAEEERFEAELRQLEAQLGLTVTASELPEPSAGILAWPFDDAYMQKCASFAKALKNPSCITQYFGSTPFATANPQVYGGRGHNAIDFRAPDGTPIRAARDGMVEAIGNTDEQRGCYSYGKWVLLKHENGLSTLYAHLSSITVPVGGIVGKGGTVGYSGRTGYATGPHLHFGVFASAGVKVTQFTGSRNCKQVTVPLVDPSAYLNPLSYLPR